jgi:hypothetical protein
MLMSHKLKVSASSPANHTTTHFPSPLQSVQLLLLPSWLRRNWPVLQRLLVTLGMLVIIRLGYFIPVPGVDLGSLPAAAYGMEGKWWGSSSSSSSGSASSSGSSSASSCGSGSGCW